MTPLSSFHHWDVVALCAALAVVFGFEMLGVLTTHYITITAIVRTYMPFWMRAMILGWMCYHFMIQPPK